MKPPSSLKDKFYSFAAGVEGFTAPTMIASLGGCVLAVTAGGMAQSPFATQLAISTVFGAGTSFFAAFGVGMSGRFFRGDAPYNTHKSYERMGRITNVALPILAGIGVAVGLNNAFTSYAQEGGVTASHVACEDENVVKTSSPHITCRAQPPLSL